jgi:hypothetical protein
MLYNCLRVCCFTTHTHTHTHRMENGFADLVTKVFKIIGGRHVCVCVCVSECAYIYVCANTFSPLSATHYSLHTTFHYTPIPATHYPLGLPGPIQERVQAAEASYAVVEKHPYGRDFVVEVRVCVFFCFTLSRTLTLSHSLSSFSFHTLTHSHTHTHTQFLPHRTSSPLCWSSRQRACFRPSPFV